MTNHTALARARTLRRLSILARDGQHAGARKAILRAAERLTTSGLLSSEGRAIVADAVWACQQEAA